MKPKQDLKPFSFTKFWLNSWFVAVLISLLVHLMLFGVDIKTISKQQVKTINIEFIVQKASKPKDFISKHKKPDVALPLHSKKQEQPIASKQHLKVPISSRLRAEEKIPLHVHGLSVQLPRQKNTDTKSVTKKRVKTDWNNVAKEFIREKSDKDILREKRHDELWFKSQSIMYGKPRDYFDNKQDKRAMLIEPGESKRKSYFPKKKKNSDFGIKLGKHCFLGFKDMDKIKQGDPRLGGIPFSCDF